MASVLFHPIVAVQPETGELVRGADGQIFAESDTSFTSPLPTYDALGTPIERVSVGPNGLTQAFRVDNLDRVVWKSGPFAIPVWSPTGVLAAAQQAAQLASEAAAAAEAVQAAIAAGGGGGGGVSRHGALSGLGEDDHLQYLTAERGDARYPAKGTVSTAIATAVATASDEDRKRGNHSGTQSITSIEGLASQLNDKADLIAGKIRQSQLPVVIIMRTADQGIPTAADCIAAGYPDNALIFTVPR